MIGTTLGTYHVLSKLGAGGMGEVYRARDSKLGRDVAIKVLPAKFQSDRDRLARFDREARALAAVNHSNIGVIYGIEEEGGTTALVLELVEGKTLAERVRRGPVPLPEAIDIAKQIAGGLDAAHAKEIIHRDLKPSNIKITPQGVVKILDFGLAKAMEDVEVAGASTMTLDATREGAILGTAAYMSPEQARGQKMDARTDIWTFMLPTFVASLRRVFYLVRSVSARAYASGELWSVDVTTGQKERMLPGRVMGNYSLSRDAKKVVFTDAGGDGERGVWIADLDRRAPPRQLTNGGEFRAFFGAPGEIVYLSQGPVRYLYRMKEDGSQKQRISSEPITYLIAVSPDGRWGVALNPRENQNGGGTRLAFMSLAGEPSITLCNDDCSLGFGPARVQAPIIHWSHDGTLLSVSLQYFGLRTPRTVVLPYRADVALDSQYPRGMITEADLMKNPGAKVINERNVFPITASDYLVWKLATQSNLYQVPLPR